MRVTLATLGALCASFVFLMPILWMVSSSLRRPSDRFSVDGVGIPWVDFEPRFNAWAAQLTDPVVRDGIGRSTIIAVAAMVLALLVAVPAGWALAREARYGSRSRSDVITGILLIARVVPPITLVIPLYLLIEWAGLIDTMVALVLVNASLVLPFIVVIMRQAFLELPPELEEAAVIDGAPARIVLTHVILPVATPALAASALISLAYVWNDYLFALSFFRLETRTMPMLIEAGAGSAGAMVRTIIAITLPAIVALVAQRYIVQGLTFGAVSK